MDSKMKMSGGTEKNVVCPALVKTQRLYYGVMAKKSKKKAKQRARRAEKRIEQKDLQPPSIGEQFLARLRYERMVRRDSLQQRRSTKDRNRW